MLIKIPSCGILSKPYGVHDVFPVAFIVATAVVRHTIGFLTSHDIEPGNTRMV